MRIENVSRMLRLASVPRVTFGDVMYGADGECGPRVQADYQVVVLLEGEARVTVDSEEWRLGPGEAGLFLPGRQEWFRFTRGARTHHTWCTVAPGLVDKILATACAAAPRVQKLSGRLADLMELGLGLPRRAAAAEAGLVESLGMATLHEYLLAARLEAAGGGATEEPPGLRRALDWIGRHAPRATDLRTLAKEAGVSPALLTRQFRTHLGTTPMRAVWAARTARGVRLLRETGLSVGEVAVRCGFQTPFHFSRWVRETEGVSPRELRARAWGR